MVQIHPPQLDRNGDGVEAYGVDTYGVEAYGVEAYGRTANGERAERAEPASRRRKRYRSLVTILGRAF